MKKGNKYFLSLNHHLFYKMKMQTSFQENMFAIIFILKKKRLSDDEKIFFPVISEQLMAVKLVSLKKELPLKDTNRLARLCA